MKYLKKYNEATNWHKETIPNNVQLELIDISLEIKDIGFNIGYQWCPPYERHSQLYKYGKYLPYIKLLVCW